jgi:hypothetical protein
MLAKASLAVALLVGGSMVVSALADDVSDALEQTTSRSTG